MLSCHCFPADQSKLMTDVCWNKCDSLWSWCGISSTASISFYAFHTFLLAWMDHNGRMWFEREPWGPWDPHTKLNHIIPSSWEPHTIPLPYHTQLLRTAYHTPTISYQRPHSILTLYFSQVQHSKRITHSFQGSPLVSDCSKIWCLQSDSPWCWSVFPLGEEHSSHLGWWPWPGLGSHIEMQRLKLKWFCLIFDFEWFLLMY